MTTSELYREHVEQLLLLSDAGDEMAAKSLACLALVCEGWRYGDPDPTDPGPDGDGGLPLPDNVLLFRRAA